MIKNFFLLFILFCIMLIQPVFAYDDDLFKFDLPKNYKNFNYNNQLMAFMDENNKERGFSIIIFEVPGLKKSVWDIDKNDLRKIIASSMTGTTIEVEDRGKLGKEKAIRYVMYDKEDNDYM